MLDRISVAFAAGLLAPPPVPLETPFSAAIEAYNDLALTGAGKTVFVF
jgi:hypothetical protein